MTDDAESKQQEVPFGERFRGVPHLHPEVRTVHEPRHGYVLMWTVPLPEKAGWWRRLLEPNGRRHRLVLDDLGRKTIELMDGKRSLSDISDKLSADLNVGPEDVRPALLAFVTDLMKRNIAAVIEPGKGKSR